MNSQEKIMSGLTDLFNKIDSYYLPQMEAAFSDITVSEIEAIEFIAKNAWVNVTKLAENLYITRGAASKITKKLLLKKFIESYQKSSNKKEIYFQLTPAGQAINDKHESQHKEFLEHDKSIFDELTKADRQSILTFLDKYNAFLDKALRER